ncbi:MAG: hypothetical protein R3F59_19230 [Myxococcota bacterium]
MRPWDLNAVVLAHVNRFFQAARRVVPHLQDDQASALVGFAGNLLWANSAFADVPDAQKRAMAVVGGAAKTLADQLDLGGGRQRVAQRAMDDLEQELLAHLDPLLEGLVRDIEAAGLAEASPGTVDAWVWQRLFPGYPWAAGEATLEAAILARLA